MKKRFLLILLLSLTITACTSNSGTTFTETPTYTQKPTSTLESTSMPTQIPLSDIQLEEIAINDGDLPAGYSGAQIRDVAPAMFDNLPQSDKTIYQQLAKDGDTKDGVTIFLYESQEKIDSAFSIVYDGLTNDAAELDEIGDRGYIDYVSMTVLGSKEQFGDLSFIRCNAVVHIRMNDLSSDDSLLAYAKRLDKRISEIICP